MHGQPSSLCTNDLAVISRIFLPQTQKTTPLQLNRVMRAMLVRIGGTKPSFSAHDVRNLDTPYPHRFLLIVMVTKTDPVTGL